MSQVIFHHVTHDGRTLRVMGGFDVPLQHYHLLVEQVSPEPEDPDAYVYASLDDPNAHMGGHIEPSYFLNVLENTLHITPPEGFWERFERREGNVVRTYDAENNTWLVSNF